MILTKKGNKYTGNSYKSYSQDAAIKRLESAVHKLMHVHKTKEISENLVRWFYKLSKKNKERFEKALCRMEAWCDKMIQDNQKDGGESE